MAKLLGFWKAIFALVLPLPAVAQPKNEARIDTPRPEPDAIPRYGDTTPGRRSEERSTSSDIGLGIRKLARPTMTPASPRRGTAKRPDGLHVYLHEDHGFGVGIAGQANQPLMNEFAAWLWMQGFDKRKTLQ